MRIIGYILVACGALALGFEEFVQAVRAEVPVTRVPPAVGGIVLVTGLLVLATVLGRRSDS